MFFRPENGVYLYITLTEIGLITARIMLLTGCKSLLSRELNDS